MVSEDPSGIVHCCRSPNPTVLTALTNLTMKPRYPLSNHSRKKSRRWPLVLRVVKGAVHGEIVAPVALHALFTLAVVLLDRHVGNVSLPPIFIPSLSIVVGLMLVFRNGTSYDRFWTGRNQIGTVAAAVRNLSRSFLAACVEAL